MISSTILREILQYSPALKKAVTVIDESLNEETEEKRYVVGIDMYMYAKDDNEVQQIAERFVKHLKAQYDNQAVVMSIYEQPFGTLTSRKLFDKNN